MNPSPPNGRKTILIAEDEDDVRRLLAEMLRRAGFQVIAAAGGAEALAACGGAAGMPAAPTIDLLITDVSMPGMAGPELARQFSAAHPAAQILFISGFSDATSASAIADRAGAHYLSKPFGAGELLATVRALLA